MKRGNNVNFNARKQVAVLTAVIAMILVVLIDSSYAWYTVTKTSDKTVGIKAGTLNLEFDKGESEEITLTDVIPLRDQDALSSEGYSFKVTNRGSISSNYTISLVDKDLNSGEDKLDEKYVKYNIERDGESVKTDFLSTLEEGKIVAGSLDKDGESTFTIRLWLDENTFTKDATNKVLKKTIKISATQKND